MEEKTRFLYRLSAVFFILVCLPFAMIFSLLDSIHKAFQMIISISEGDRIHDSLLKRIDIEEKRLSKQRSKIEEGKRFFG